MNKITFFILCLLPSLTLAQTVNLRPYYFPIDSLLNGSMTYIYHAQYDKDEYEITVALSAEEAKKKSYILQSELLTNGVKTERVTERINQVGAFMEKYEEGMTMHDEILFSELRLSKTEVMKWEMEEGESITFETISHESWEEKPAVRYLQKERRFVGFQKVVVMGQSYEAAKFWDEVRLRWEDNDGKVLYEMKSPRYSYYVKGIGLVKLGWLPGGVGYTRYDLVRIEK